MFEHTSGKGTSKLPVVEEFYTLQGEGFHTGKAAYFIRIGGCDIGCRWCDSAYTWNAAIHPETDVDSLVEHAVNCKTNAVVITGGEPLMWDMDYLCTKLKEKNIETFLETSGAYPLTGIWDWICLSPKKKAPPLPGIYNLAHELKVIIADDSDFKWALHNLTLVEKNCHLFLQPEWSVHKSITPAVVEFIKEHPEWRISLQSHKFMRIP